MKRCAFLFCCCLLAVVCCKKEKEKEYYTVEAQSDKFVFSNLYSDTVTLDFALVRTVIPDTLTGGTLLNGFYLDTGTLPIALVPQVPVSIEKNRFVYKNKDTLRNEQELQSISYNIREQIPGTSKDTVKTFVKNFQ